MVHSIDHVYEEMVSMKNDLERKLSSNDLSPSIKQWTLQELHDIEYALEKWENGTFGTCEVTGEPIPFDLLYAVPTARTVFEQDEMLKYCRKPLTPID